MTSNRSHDNLVEMPDDMEIRRICLGLIPKNRLRMIAERILERPNACLNNIEFEAVLSVLDEDAPSYVLPSEPEWHSQNRVNNLAQWIVVHARLSDEQRGAALTSLHQTSERLVTAMSPRRISLRAHLIVEPPFCVLLLFLVSILLDPFQPDRICEIIIIVVGFLLIKSVRKRVRNKTKQIDAERSSRLLGFLTPLASIGNAESAGYAAAALRFPLTHSGALDVLNKLVEPMTVNDYGTVARKSISYLRDALDHADDETALVLFKALHAVGDKNCIPIIKKNARRLNSVAVSAEADLLVQALKIRSEQINNSATLLRSSAVIPQAGYDLLRAASSAAAIPPEEMLRAAAEDRSEDYDNR